MNTRITCLAVVLSLVAATSAFAQSAPTTRVKGKLASVEGLTITVGDGAGVTTSVVLSPDFAVATVEQASLAAIKPGTFVGCGAMTAPDGTIVATEVHIFPESLRGTGEGSRAWEFGPSSTMTNANVTANVDGVKGRTLTLTYQGGEKAILVPPETPIVSYAVGGRADLRPGTSVLVRATKRPDGSLQASRVIAGLNGVVPPM